MQGPGPADATPPPFAGASNFPLNEGGDAISGEDIIIRLVEALAWPLLILVLVLLFKQHLAALLGRLRSWDSPVGKYEFGEGTAPAPKAGATSSESTDAIALGDMARRILNTLWHYQQQHFPDPKKGRWTFGLHPASPFWIDYTRALAELFNAGLIEHNPANGQVFLTNRGIDYSERHSSSLGHDMFMFS